MRLVGMVGAFAALIFLAQSVEARERCPAAATPADNGNSEEPAPPGAQLLLADALCDAPARRELRLQLLEIPQDGEDPTSLSVGLKSGGGLLRFKIPFSF